jgi:hypothetical protein
LSINESLKQFSTAWNIAVPIAGILIGGGVLYSQISTDIANLRDRVERSERQNAIVIDRLDTVVEQLGDLKVINGRLEERINAKLRGDN